MSTSLLLADDSATIAKILGMALQAEPIAIRSVQTADAAMAELLADPPTYFLVDLTLPEKNGYDFARFVKSDEKLKDVKVLLLSSAFEPVDEAEFAACGADAVLAKPFDPSDLRNELRKLSGLPPRGASSDDLPDFGGGDSPEDPSSLLEAPGGGADADSILAGLINNPSESNATGALDLGTLDLGDNPLSAFTNQEQAYEPQDPTTILDLSGNMEFRGHEEQVLDLSGAFNKTPPGGTAILETPASLREHTNPEAGFTIPKQAEAPPAKAPDLSANAQALAAFFSAEIDANGPPSAPPAPAAVPAAPAAPEEDPFEASMGALDWGSPDNLGSWSAQSPKPAATKPISELPPKVTPVAPPSSPPRSVPMPASPPTTPPTSAAPPRATPSAPGFVPRPSAPPATPPSEAPKLVSPSRPSPSPMVASAPGAVAPHRPPASPPPGSTPGSTPPAGATTDRGSFLFDTGGSNFRFADDYVARITRSFTGAVDEMILGKDPSPAVAAASGGSERVFPTTSSDAPESKPPQSGLRPGGGTWSEEEMKRIEQLVREEVQMVVREMVEKVAWEVIPELAENLIRKQLDSVLKEIEGQ